MCPRTVHSNLHLSETILSVVTAAVSPLRLFLYIFSPCWFLLSLVLMMLSTAHSTAWSDLKILYYCLEAGEDCLPCPADLTADTQTTLGALSPGSWLDQFQTVDTLTPSSSSTRHGAGSSHCCLGREDGFSCQDVPGGHQPSPSARDLRHCKGSLSSLIIITDRHEESCNAAM